MQEFSSTHGLDRAEISNNKACLSSSFVPSKKKDDDYKYKNTIFAKFRQDLNCSRGAILEDIRRSKEIYTTTNASLVKNEDDSPTKGKNFTKESAPMTETTKDSPLKRSNDCGRNQTVSSKFFPTEVRFGSRYIEKEANSREIGKRFSMTNTNVGRMFPGGRQDLSLVPLLPPHKKQSVPIAQGSKFAKSKTSVKQNCYSDKGVRLKDFSVAYENNWYEKNSLIPGNFNKAMVNNLDYQSSILIDEMKVLMDNVENFKMNFLNGKEFFNFFSNMEGKKQAELNIKIEKTCGLLIQIANLILLDFANYLEKFVSVRPPHPDRLMMRMVKNEDQEFFTNIKLFKDITQFMKGCKEVYLALVNQVDDMVIPFQEFVKVCQFLSRCRMNISELIFTAKNSLSNHYSDKQLYKKYSNFKERQDKQRNQGQKGKSLNVNRNKNFVREKEDLADKIRRQLKFRVNEDNERIRHLNNLLNKKSETDEKRIVERNKKIGKKKFQHIKFSGTIFDSLLKYCSRDIKNDIIIERIRERNGKQQSDD